MIAWLRRNGAEPFLGLVIIISTAMGVEACGVFTSQNAKSALSILEVACVIAHAETDDATVAQVCGIADALIPSLKLILAEQRKAVAAARRAGACWPADAGPDAGQ
jgi:hypothetical protein